MMYINRFLLKFQKTQFILITSFYPEIQSYKRFYHNVPFVSLYEKVTGQVISDSFGNKLKKKHSKVYSLSDEDLQSTLLILRKFGISAEEACMDPHVFCMNPISMDNYGEILTECGFTKVKTKHIIRYLTLVKSRTITQLKKEGLLKHDHNVEKSLHDSLHDWPKENIGLKNFPESSTNILTVRMSVLERYLQWKLCITSGEFSNYCKNYLPLKHRPMCDIRESLYIAQNNINFDEESIRRNGFIISSDPANTKFILENVGSLGGLDIRQAIKTEPAILKNNYQSLLKIQSILKQYGITNEAQRRCLKVFCMCPKTVQERLEQLVNMKEYQVLSTNPRVLYMVVHEKKMINRINKIQAARKQCFSLNHLVSSSKVFNTYINSFGEKVCSRDIAVLIKSSLQSEGITNKSILEKLRKHKYWLHTALNVIQENVLMLKKNFDDDVIYNNCQILLYPSLETERYIDYLQNIRKGKSHHKENKQIDLDAIYNNLNFRQLTDDQILSLVLYEIEKKYHFSGDGIWNRNDGHSFNQKVKQTSTS